MSDGTARFFGIIILGIGALLAYLCVVMPLNDIEAHASSVTISLKGAALVPMTGIFGVLYLVLGAKAHEAMMIDKKPTVLGWVVAIAAIIMGLMLNHYLQRYAESLGYEFH